METSTLTNQTEEYLDECYSAIDKIQRSIDKLRSSFDNITRSFDEQKSSNDKLTFGNNKNINSDVKLIKSNDNLTNSDDNLTNSDDKLTNETDEVIAVLDKTNFKKKNSSPKMRIKGIIKFMIENKTVEYKKLRRQFYLSVPQLSRDLSFLYSTGMFKKVRDSKTNLCQYTGKPKQPDS